MDYKKDLYIMMEINFLKENNRTTQQDNSDLFPTGWDLSDNYQLKTEILLEAINKKIKIIETDKYQYMIEKVI